MNILDIAGDIFEKIFSPKKHPTPADFRRGYRKHNIIGYLIDHNSKHVGQFKGGITPMKRRRKGVSRTAKGGKQ